MNIKEIKQLINLVQHSNILELSVSAEKYSIKIIKNNISCSQELIKNKTIIDNDIKNNEYNATEQNTLNNGKSKKTISHENKNYIVKSPMVGIFYITHDNASKPFVKVGQKISVGDTLCIIEAMKTINHISSEKDGTIHSILVKNGCTVEFNEPLFIIT